MKHKKLLLYGLVTSLTFSSVASVYAEPAGEEQEVLDALPSPAEGAEEPAMDEEGSLTSYRSESIQADETAEDEENSIPKSGWVTENGICYYYLPDYRRKSTILFSRGRKSEYRSYPG